MHARLEFSLRQVQAVVELLDEGNTVPFITRYRKDHTGGLDEEQIRQIQDRLSKMRQLADRKQTVLRSIEAQGKLPEKLEKQILAATTTKRLEDLISPTSPRTDASNAGTLPRPGRAGPRDPRGAPPPPPTSMPAPAISPIQTAKYPPLPTPCWGRDMSWPSSSASGPICGSGSARSSSGTGKIITFASAKTRSPRSAGRPQSGSGGGVEAPRMRPGGPATPGPRSQPNRRAPNRLRPKPSQPRPRPSFPPLPERCNRSSPSPRPLRPRNRHPGPRLPPTRRRRLSRPRPPRSPARKGPRLPGRNAKSRKKWRSGASRRSADYFSYTEEVRKIPPHRVLAINRGEQSRVFRVKLEADMAAMYAAVDELLVPPGHPHADYLPRRARDALARLILPALEREARRELTDRAELHAVVVFARISATSSCSRRSTTAASWPSNPGSRAAAKLAALDQFGNVLGHDVIMLVGQVVPHDEARQKSLD